MKKVLAFAMAFLLLAVMVIPVLSAELVSTEVVASTDNAVIEVEQGQTVSFDIHLTATGAINGGVTSSNPDKAAINTSFTVDGTTVASASLSNYYDFYASSTQSGGSGNYVVTWNGAPNPYTVSATASASMDAEPGDYTIQIPATFDNADVTGGKMGDATPDTLTIRVTASTTPSDTTPPTTTIDLPVIDGNNGWYRSPVEVTLTATDNEGGSGVKEIHYILDGGTEQTVTGASATFTISTDGTHSLEYWAVDNSNNVETPHNTATIKIDTTDPVFDTFVVPTGVILNQPDVEVTWTAHDVTSGLATSNPTSPITIDTSTVGTKTGSVTLYDVAGNSVSHTYSVSVGYNVLGFLQPINMDNSSIFKQGSTVPVKFQLTDYFGNYVSNAVARLTNIKFTDVPVGDEMESVSTSAATTGNLFRYDTTSNQYIFNLGTKSLVKGGYRITATLDSGQIIQVVISLK